MRLPSHSLCCVYLLLCLTGLGPSLALAIAATGAGDPPTFTPCELTGSAGNGRASAECATWLRPLDPADPSKGEIEVFVARIASTASNPAKDALTLVNGGPGAASTELYVDYANLFDSVRRERDIILLDQRGTGRSSALNCSASDEELAFETAASSAEYGKRCFAELPFDTRYFTTSIAVADLEALRLAMGYSQLNLYGVSYGTRVVQHYARQYPAAVRTITIDGVLPPTLAMGPMVPLNAQRALDSIVARCNTDKDCHRAFPTLAEDFLRLSDQLKQAPVTLTVADPNTGRPRELTLGYGHLAVTVRLMSYATETTSLIPVIISEAANAQNFLPIATQALQMESQLGNTMSYGMHFAVVCTEDIPFLESNPEQAARVATTYLGQEQVDSLTSVCANWPAGVIDETLKTPWQSGLPTLILSGEFDPITVHEYGSQVAQGLTNAQHVIVPGHGHGVIARGCIPRLFNKFIETAEPEALDATCVERLGPDPFFLDLMGPRR